MGRGNWRRCGSACRGRWPPGGRATGQRAGRGVPSGDRRRDPHPRVGHPMRDPRVQNLAKILVQYSTAVKKDDAVVIGGASSAEPLLLAIYEEVLQAGGNPIMQMAPEEAAASVFPFSPGDPPHWVP